MSTNYNQLLKDLEIGSVYVKILICFWDVLSCYIHSCFISPISSGSFPYMNRSFHIRQFCPIYGNRNTTIRYIFQVSCFLLRSVVVTDSYCLPMRLSASSWLVLCIKNDTVMLFTVLRISNLRYRRNNINF